VSDPGSVVVNAILIIPAASAAALALLPDDRTTARLNVLASLLTLACAIALFFERPEPGLFLIVDDVNVVFIVLNTFVGFTTSVFSGSYIAHELEIGRLTHAYLRFYHAMYQTLMFAMNLALLANNVGLMWVAIELATLTTVLMVGIYRTHEALEAAWKYFILGSVGIALALFGTILVYLAASSVLGEGLQAMAWNILVQRAQTFDPALLNLAFVFLLLGYGTKVGLAPLHAWLPDAHAEGPTPISAVLSGLLLNVALFAVLRFKMVMSANARALAPGPLMVTMGLVSVVFAAFMLYRRDDIKRMFAYSSIEHMGIISFAFGMGGRPVAHDDALAHQVRDLLRRRAYRTGQGHAEDGGHPRSHRLASDPRMGTDPGRGHDRRTAADGHLHERIPVDHVDLCSRPRAGRRVGGRTADRHGSAAVSPEWHGLRRGARRQPACAGVLCAAVHASRVGPGRRNLPPAATGLLVSACRGAAGLDARSETNEGEVT
jgi:hydrogenase-4 component F